MNQPIEEQPKKFQFTPKGNTVDLENEKDEIKIEDVPF